MLTATGRGGRWCRVSGEEAQCPPSELLQVRFRWLRPELFSSAVGAKTLCCLRRESRATKSPVTLARWVIAETGLDAEQLLPGVLWRNPPPSSLETLHVPLRLNNTAPASRPSFDPFSSPLLPPSYALGSGHPPRFCGSTQGTPAAMSGRTYTSPPGGSIATAQRCHEASRLPPAMLRLSCDGLLTVVATQSASSTSYASLAARTCSPCRILITTLRSGQTLLAPHP